MIIADLNLISDTTEFEELIIGGASTSTYTETNASPNSALAISNANASGNNTFTNTETLLTYREINNNSLIKVYAKAEAYAQDPNSFAYSRSRSTEVYLGTK
ncbi:MAG: hypothetical protein KME64_23000 [Scytonematopsis contorta HA4267-MV1]|jgi:hypothetical protein|nr:hypothetical protein [Scytonematopsis contorta HA4267-MV1]